MTGSETRVSPKESFRSRFDRPIFIVSTPRAGSTLLFETMKQAPRVGTIGQESHWLIEDIRGLSPSERAWSSNRLTEADADPATAEALSRAFYEALRDRDGHAPDGKVRMVEKTPKNSLRVRFFKALYPDAAFIYLYRDVRQTLYSMLEAWASGAFRTYPDLPGWSGTPWSLLLIPGWERLRGMPLPTVVASQWATTTDLLLDDLESIQGSVRVVEYEEFLGAPQAVMERLCGSLDLEWDRVLGARLPLSATTLSDPRADKWRRIGGIIESMMPVVARADERARAFVERFRS